jgi:hypothetical protein
MPSKTPAKECVEPKIICFDYSLQLQFTKITAYFFKKYKII